MRRAIATTARRAAAPRANHPDTTHFGFRDIPTAAKQGLVGEVFSRVASQYDVMNDAMSGFLHRVWKDAFVADLTPTSAMRILDCAAGTGDIAFRVLRAAPGASVTMMDPSPEMLANGRARAATLNFDKDALRFVKGNAENLPFADDSFDAYTISFGMRNVPRPHVAVDEALRILRPGGRFLMLEFAHVRNSALRAAYDAYSFNVIPSLGAAIVGDRASYQYLVESIRKFPKQEEFLQIMKDAGLVSTSVTDYSFGIAASYSGFKRPTAAVRSKDNAVRSVAT